MTIYQLVSDWPGNDFGSIAIASGLFKAIESELKFGPASPVDIVEFVTELHGGGEELNDKLTMNALVKALKRGTVRLTYRRGNSQVNVKIHERYVHR